MNYVRKIRCPRHYLLRPGHDPFIREPEPLLKGVSKSACITFGVKKERIKRDRYGNPMQNFRSFYQPEISAAFAIEHVYDPLNPICKQCKRCLEGLGVVNTRGIKRLNG